MMEKETNNNIVDPHDLIICYLDGVASLEEKKELLQWLQSSDENKNDFIEIRDLWLACDSAVGHHVEMDIALERLRSRVFSAEQNRVSRKRFRISWQHVAAAFLVLLSIGYGIYGQRTVVETVREIVIQNQLITAKGSKGQFILPDGSIVWLNSGSKLIYPEQFEEGCRLVTLEGEAYFQVTEDKSRPFIVQAKDVEIEVLGTSFNISNHAALNTVETVLITGSIEANINATGETFLLKPNELLTYEKETGEAITEITSAQYHIDWIKDRLIFDNDRLSDIITSLEGWYAVRIDCPKYFSEKQRLSFTVRGENLEEILLAMSLIIPIKYTINENQVKIDPLKN
ncbi:transmembrane sensor [Parabacteroides sp. PFB2-10]|uniref:FecR domain-containing protein n=1 Tax=Parabacteroides sp. PFB2-10 TaxID=1742405 RepID=UPI00247469DD|nr:FecR domain-containing protein [Parabacteroides sp. PFB2-10]MDH6312920.1 transmembrane sensor [Parabacteroides sp. PFB2-10]